MQGLLLATLLLNLFPRPDQGPPQVASAARLVDSLQAQLSTRVVIARDLASQPLLIEPGGAIARSLLDAIAFALHAHVVSAGSLLSIERTAADRAEIRSADAKFLSARMDALFGKWDAQAAAEPADSDATNCTAALQSFAKALRSIPPPGEHQPDFFLDAGRCTPADRLLRRLLSQIPRSEITAIAIGETRYFALAPTAAEIGVRGAEPALNEFRQRQERFASDPRLEDAIRALPEIFRNRFQPSTGSSLSGLRPILAARRREDALLFDLRIYNSERTLVATASESTVGGESHSPAERAWLARSGGDASLELSPMATEYVGRHPAWEPRSVAAMSSQKPQRPNPERDDPRWPDVLLHPDKHDPDDLFVAPAVDAICRDRRGPLVAALPDALFTDARLSIWDGRLDLGAFRELFRDSCERSQLGAIAIVRPSNPRQSEPLLTDRTALASAMQEFWSARAVNLRAWCVLCFKEGPSMRLSLGYASFLCEHWGIARLPSMGSDNGVAALLGSVPDPEWPSVGQAKSVPLQTSEQKSALRRILDEQRPPYDERPELPDTAREPAEQFPDGLPPGEAIAFRPMYEPELRRSNPAGDAPFMPPDQLAAMAMKPKWRRYPSLAPSSPEETARNFDDAFGPLEPGAKVFTRVVFQVAPGLLLHHDLPPEYRSVGPPARYSKLPDNYRRLLDAAWSREQERAKAKGLLPQLQASPGPTKP